MKNEFFYKPGCNACGIAGCVTHFIVPNSGERISTSQCQNINWT